MTESKGTVVHVDTVEEYSAVLEKWFKEGHDWYSNTNGKQKTHADYFTKYNARYLLLECRISHSTGEAIDTTKAVSFKEFMAKERNEVTYRVSEAQMAFIKRAKDSVYPASYLMTHVKEYTSLYGVESGTTFEQDLLRYLGGDDRVVFQLMDPVFMLKGRDTDGDAVYFRLNTLDVPTYTYDKPDAFVASLKVITRWNTPFWEIVLVEA